MGLLNTAIKSKLLPGKYPVQLITYDEKHQDESKKGPLDYIQLTIAIQTGEKNPKTGKEEPRIVKANFFEGNINYLGSALRNQLKRDDAMELVDILEEAKKSTSLFGVVSYNDYGFNLAFHEKTAETDEEVKA